MKANLIQLVSEKLIDAAKIAKNNSFHVQEFYVNDFKLMLHWDDRYNWFVCVLHYSPRSSSYHFYELDVEKLIDMIVDEMISWGGKGNYKR